MKAKLVTGKFFMERVLPESAAHLKRITTGADTMMELPAEALSLSSPSACGERSTREAAGEGSCRKSPLHSPFREGHRASARMSGNSNLTGGCSAARCAMMDDDAGLFERVLLPHVPESLGAAVHGLTGGKIEHLTWTRGTPSFFRSSSMAQRGFCQDCGTPLTYGFDGNGRISVTINSLDDPKLCRRRSSTAPRAKLSWLKGVHDLPAQRTDEWMKKTRRDKMVNNQRSDESVGGATRQMESLQVPRPSWMTEDLVLLEEQARRFSRASSCRMSRSGRKTASWSARPGTSSGRRAALRLDAGGIRRRGRLVRA
jgi:hypothetical protein